MFAFSTYLVVLNFYGSLILAMGDFLCVCFAGTTVCDWEKLVFLAGNYFLRFSGTRLLFGITAFSILEFKQWNTGEQQFFYYFI